MKLKLEMSVKGTVPEVFKRFDRQLFEFLKPPLLPVAIERFDGCEVGHEIHLKLSVGPWISIITERVEGPSVSYFVDEGRRLPFPFKYWRHQHVVRSEKGQTMLVDDIEYKTGGRVLDILVWPILYAMFKARHPLYRRYFGES